MSEPKKILVIRLKQIGDALLSLPVCNSLQATYPDAQIDYLVYEHIAQLLEDQASINRLLVITPQERNNKFHYMKKAWWLRQQHYDMVIDLINVPVSAMLSRFCGAKHVIGFDKKRWRKMLYKTKVPHPDVGDTVLKKLAILQGLPEPASITRDWSIKINQSEQAMLQQRLDDAGVDVSRTLIFIAATSRRDYKFWPINYFAQVLDHLKTKHDAQLLFNWVPGSESVFVNELVDMLDNKDDVYADVPFSLRELPIAISCCDFFFGNDGGPGHMAVGTGVPSLVIFSPIHKKGDWLPWKSTMHVGVDLRDTVDVDDEKWGSFGKDLKQNINHYYQLITPELVIEKLDQHLKQFL